MDPAPSQTTLSSDQCRRQPHYTTGEKATRLDLPAVGEREDQAKEFDLAHFGGAEVILNRGLSSSGGLRQGFEKREGVGYLGKLPGPVWPGRKKICISDVSERPEPTPVPLLAIGLLSLGYFHGRQALQCGIVANLEEILSDLYESKINISIS